jgi:hypothetical protein
MTTSMQCSICRKPIKPDADYRTVEVLNAGVPEPAAVHAKCLERHEQSFARFMKNAEKLQAKQQRQLLDLDIHGWVSTMSISGGGSMVKPRAKPQRKPEA